MDLGLRGKVLVVSGGSRGLGLATARALRAEGAEVVIGSRSPEAAAAELGVVGVPLDLADPGSAQALVDAALQAHGRLDGALVSVGGPPAGTALGLTDAQWQGAFDSVFLGAVRLCRAVVEALPPQGGALALVLSSSVKSPIGGLAASNGLRPGLGMLAKTMADELGPRGVRVNGLLPGRVATDRLVSWTGPTRRSLRATPPPSRCAATATPTSSAAWPRSCCRPPRPTSRGRWSRSTAARSARSSGYARGMSDNTSSHPGLGEGTDISVSTSDDHSDAPVPASLDPQQRRDDDLGAGDGVDDVQPGGAG
ncbi:MAG: short-chain dehydrogenase/reductase [Frankiales bacterium]|nr:short-chain dehydrogenase/reductase [Frankiales bacterium]